MMAQKQEPNKENEILQEITNIDLPKLDLDDVMKRLGGVEYEQYLSRKRKEGVAVKTQDKEQYKEIMVLCRDMMKNDKLFQQCLKQREQKEKGPQQKEKTQNDVTDTSMNIENVFMESCLQQEKLSMQPIKINQNLRKNLFGASKKAAHSIKPTQEPKPNTSSTKVNRPKPPKVSVFAKPPKVSILAKPLEMSAPRKTTYEKPKNTPTLTIEKQFDQFKKEVQKTLQQQFDDFKNELQKTLKLQFDELRNEQLKIQRQLATIVDKQQEQREDKLDNNNGKQITPINLFINSPQNSAEEFEKFEKVLGIHHTGKEKQTKVTFRMTPVKYKSESDLRKTALLKSANRSRGAIEIYNSCRNVCLLLQTPKLVNNSSNDSDDDDEVLYEKQLSKTLLKQCEMLQNTPKKPKYLQ